MIGLVGPQRLGQEHAGQPDLPLLRRDRRRHPGRRHRHPPLRRGRLPAPRGAGAAGALPVLRHHRAEHRLRQARSHARGDRRRGARRPCARLHPAPAARLRLAGRRARAGAVGRRAPAHQHRARAADRPAHPDPRRGHLGGRHRDREGNPEGARQPGAGPHHHRHRAPALDLAQGRPAGGDGPRRDRRGRAARRADGEAGRLLAALPGAAAPGRRREPRLRGRARAGAALALGGHAAHPAGEA